ncbi:ImmA/IrrE family metallo-endopeptidase [Marinigracilibium pacificum]|uniref:ImmA/IrrE family metallo-endopeptidase n=1 Tax=Marinigracilibium pacificum TaxID=2729599 RepID=A0A848IZ85_9BACT|nr:ImmA/IrrE family metallo-endopeptidase [Marinigracilibium pacificum]NMM49843.1 ImmA/IrrE family metallo-endopeptidase [Marinigracilibium pacificum]
MNQLILEKKANDFRNKNGLGSNDSIHLKSLLYKLNILTAFKPLSDSFSGMAMKVSDEKEVKRFILINSNKSLGHQHFTICHELYHLFIQENFTSMICNAGAFIKKDPEEYNADVFAAHLLLPENGVKSLIPDEELGKDKIKLETILKIEQYFSCSRAACLYRLKNLDIISKSRLEFFNQSVKKSAIQYGYSIDIYEPGNHNELIGDYGTLARNLYDNEVISESHYYSLLLDMGMNTDEIEELENNGE